MYPTHLADSKLTLPKTYEDRYICRVNKPNENPLLDNFIERGYTWNPAKYRPFIPADNMRSNNIRFLTYFILGINGVDPAFFKYISATYNVFTTLESVIMYYEPELYLQLFTEEYSKKDVIMTRMQEYIRSRYKNITSTTR